VGGTFVSPYICQNRNVTIVVCCSWWITCSTKLCFK